MNGNNSKTLVWDNIPEWAILHWSTAPGRNCSCLMRTRNDNQVHRRKLSERLHHVGGLGVIQGI